MAQFTVSATVYGTDNDVTAATSDLGRGKVATEENLRQMSLQVAMAGTPGRAFVISGLDPPPTSTALTFSYEAGRAFIDGYIVDIPSTTTITLTASSWNHVFLRLIKASSRVTNAVLEVLPKPTSGAQEDPVTPPDSIALCKLRTDATVVDQITADYRHGTRRAWGEVENTGSVSFRMVRAGTSDWTIDRTTGDVTFTFPFDDPPTVTGVTAASITVNGFTITDTIQQNYTWEAKEGPSRPPTFN